MEKQLPTYMRNMAQEQLSETLSQLDAITEDILAKGKLSETFFDEKGELLRRKRLFETSIELTEAQAYMDIKGEARSQYVMIAGEKVALTNEETRKAYARIMTKEAREQLAEIESDLAKMGIQQFRAKEEWEQVVSAASAVQAKAGLQTAILNYLSK